MTSQEPFVRLTVVGEKRAADVVLPSSLTPSALLPDLMDLLEHDGDVSRYGLFTVTGRELTSSTPLAEHRLRDGQHLRLLPIQDAPAEPIVHDVVDRIVSARRALLWNSRTSPWVLGFFTAALMLVGAWFFPGARETPWLVLGAFLLLSAAVGVTGAMELAWCYFGAALLVAMVGPTFTFAPHTPVSSVLAAWWIPAALAFIVTLGVLTKRLRSALTSATVLVALVAVAWGSHALGANRVQTGGILAVVSLLGIGVVPRIAMSGSGLYALADRVAEGEKWTVSRVDSAVAETYSALTGALVVLCAALALGLSAMAPALRLDIFTLATASVVALAALLRTRHFPLAVHRLVLPGAVLAAATAITSHLTLGSHKAAITAGAVAIILAMAVLVMPLLATSSRVRQAQGRKAAGIIERLCVLASVPLLVGIFGVYSDLLRTFQ